MFVLFLEGVFGETNEIVKIVKAGDTVTLHTGLTEIEKDDVMDWMFKTKGVVIARVEYNNNPVTYDAENEEFRGRLKADRQTGDLNITNIKTTDDGVYEVTNSVNTFRKTFRVRVTSGETPGDSGLSSGQTAGIVVGVVLLVASAVAGGICYKKKSQVL